MSQMRDFLDILTEGAQQPLSEAENGFRLFPGLPPQDYKLGSLRDVAQWQAKIIVANSANEDRKPGMWDPVGYVMVSLTDDTLIPIARSDEHHAGYDLLHDLSNPPRRLKRKPLSGLNPQDFVAVYSCGPNYVYDERGLERLTEAARKWLAWGGPDCNVVGAYGSMEGLFGTFSDLVKHGLKMKGKNGSLSVVGKRVIKAFHDLGQIVSRRTMAERNGRDTSAMDRSIFSSATKLVQTVMPILDYCWGILRDRDELPGKVKAFVDAGDVAGLTDFIFGFHGLKNSIHQAVRDAIADPHGFDTGKITAIFGDLEMANGMLADQ